MTSTTTIYKWWGKQGLWGNTYLVVAETVDIGQSLHFWEPCMESGFR